MSASLNSRWAAVLLGSLAEGGVREVVICPGSRSTPLALAAAASPRLRVWPVVDERSAGFFALGLARGGGLPAAVICTSGSAGAHLLPAVIEAAHRGVHLVLLTADRPWELHGFGAPQTTEQTGFFAGFARLEALPPPEDAVLGHLRAVVARAMGKARGPVHLNVPFREPLAPEASEGPIVHPESSDGARVSLSRSAGALASSVVEGLDGVRAALEGVERGLIVCGPREASDGFGAAVHALGERLGFPVIAEAASNARFGHPAAIAHADLLLRAPAFAAQRPQLVLRFGGGLTSKLLQGWLDASGARTFGFSDDGAVVDPAHVSESVVVGDAVGACLALTPPRARATGHREAWLRADALARETLRGGAVFGEPEIARVVVEAVPPGANLFLSSSMPIRDVDAFAPPGEHPMQVFANRGVNGIDGIVSTAAGIAAATAKPTVLLIGDLALLHDLHGLLIARQHQVPLTVVVVNNDGGGIFSFLPIAAHAEHFERLFGTPHGLDFAPLAAFAGASLERPGTALELGAAVRRHVGQRLALIELRTERGANVAHHRALQAEVAGALGGGR